MARHDSLEEVDRLDARLCLPGHGRTFTDVRGHVRANQDLVAERVDAAATALHGGPLTAFELVSDIHGADLSQTNAGWWIQETLCYLEHLERRGDARRVEGEPERWEAT